MKSFLEMTKEELLAEKKQLEKEYRKYQMRGLQLDMSRGKPSAEQLNLSMGMMDVLHSGVDLACEDGTDCRNYGVVDGIHEAKVLRKLQFKYYVRYDFPLYDARRDGQHSVV